jgi:hypothetical protein
MKLLFLLSGGICAFPNCGRSLVEPGTLANGPVSIGEVAHIVAESRQGPRGGEPMSEEERNQHINLLLLCPNHHRVVDSQPHTYSVAVLRQMKLDHEARIRKMTMLATPTAALELRAERIYSTVLPITHLPDAVFCAPCDFQDDQEAGLKRLLVYPSDRAVLLPFLLRGKQLLTFFDLRAEGNPFNRVADGTSVSVLRSTELWREPESRRRYLTLLNRSLFKYTGRLNVRYDPAHRRFYFPPVELGRPRKVRYRSLQGRWSTRRVVWQPTKRTTGELRRYWWHLAAGLRFEQMAELQWGLSIRPERHLTLDGETTLPSDEIGRRVTRLKAKMFNDLYLAEVNFWRDYLCQGKPRIILNFGSQSAVIGAEFLTVTMKWPGIPGDDKAIKEERYEDDLFTLADLGETLSGAGINWDDDVVEDEEEDGSE